MPANQTKTIYETVYCEKKRRLIEGECFWPTENSMEQSSENAKAFCLFYNFAARKSV